jgi:hypothetical protein
MKKDATSPKPLIHQISQVQVEPSPKPRRTSPVKLINYDDNNNNTGTATTTKKRFPPLEFKLLRQGGTTMSTPGPPIYSNIINTNNTASNSITSILSSNKKLSKSPNKQVYFQTEPMSYSRDDGLYNEAPPPQPTSAIVKKNEKSSTVATTLLHMITNLFYKLFAFLTGLMMICFEYGRKKFVLVTIFAIIIYLLICYLGTFNDENPILNDDDL